jgi:GTP-binding protein
MEISSAKFVKSSVGIQDCPPPVLPEYAFIGRSNVGKSSLINSLTRRGKLAKTSSTPGKTQLINHFLINRSWYLTDLPGFGFAKVPVAIKKGWEGMIRNYLDKRPNLMCTFLLVDIRHKPLANDLEFMRWMGAQGLPFYVVCTKADKLSKARLEANLKDYREVLAGEWEPLPPIIVSSSETGLGREDILGVIGSSNPGFRTPQG